MNETVPVMDFTKVEIDGILPQRPPFVMLSRLVSFDFQKTVTEFDIPGDCLFLDDDGRSLLPEGIIENIAQTCAARIGFMNKYIYHRPINIGYIAVVNDFTLSSKPQAGQRIRTVIEVTDSIMNMTVVNATVSAGDESLAQGRMNVIVDESVSI